MDNHTQDRIEDYLAGNLEGAALEQFERQLQTDPALAEELAFYRDMAAALAPGPEAALRENLELLGRKYAPAELPQRKKRYKWVVAIVFLLPFLGWLIWKTVFGKPAVPAPATTHEPVAEQTPSSENTAPIVESPAPETTKAAKNSPRLIAADFRPNPRLEELSNKGYGYRSDGFRFRVAQPAPGAILKLKNGQANFRLSGTVETSDNLITTPFRVLLFSNQPDDYENFRFLFSAGLTFEKKDALQHFRIDESLRVKPGLYYYLIEAKDSGMLYLVGKLKVVE